MERLVENEQVRIFDKGPYKEDQALLPARELEIVALTQVLNAKEPQPEVDPLKILVFNFLIQSYGVIEAASNDIFHRERFAIRLEYLGADVAYMFLNVPDTFARTAPAAKERHIAGIALRIVSTDDAEQGGLACPVLSLQGPVLAASDEPVEIFEYCAIAVLDAHVTQAQDLVAVSPIAQPWRQLGKAVVDTCPHAVGQRLRFEAGQVLDS